MVVCCADCEPTLRGILNSTVEQVLPQVREILGQYSAARVVASLRKSCVQNGLRNRSLAMRGEFCPNESYFATAVLGQNSKALRFNRLRERVKSHRGAIGDLP